VKVKLPMFDRWAKKFLAILDIEMHEILHMARCIFEN
jgi:hypothetical protein